MAFYGDIILAYGPISHLAMFSARCCPWAKFVHGLRVGELVLGLRPPEVALAHPDG